MSCSDSQQNSSSSKRKCKGSNWTKTETRCFLNLCIEKRIIQMMDGKRHKHIDIYNSLEPSMKEMGFIKSGAQMKIKLKHLKEIYFKCKRNNNTSGVSRQTFVFYDEMEQLYCGRSSVQANTDIVVELTEPEMLQVEDNIEADLEDKIKENEKIVNDTTSPKKRKTGRNTHMKLAEKFAEVFAKKQAKEIQKVMKEQMRMFDDAIHAQLDNQRKWEKEMIEKEYQHQTSILETFMKGLQTMQSTNLQYPQFTPTSVPVHTFPSTSASQNVCPYHLSPSPSLSHSSSSSNETDTNKQVYK